MEITAQGMAAKLLELRDAARRYWAMVDDASTQRSPQGIALGDLLNAVRLVGLKMDQLRDELIDLAEDAETVMRILGVPYVQEIWAAHLAGSDKVETRNLIRLTYDTDEGKIPEWRARILTFLTETIAKAKRWTPPPAPPAPSPQPPLPQERPPGQGTKVMIGHGRSLLWRELKDFIQDRLRLPYDEFNRVPVAGVTNVERLTEMLDNAAVALLVLTAEDETSDRTTQPRMNVVHEAGLFQGRLGFKRAIVLLEEGCEEFSNIQGLGQIRFPKGNLKAAFDQVREVLERERIIEPLK